MRIVIPDDHQDAARSFECFARLRDHDEKDSCGLCFGQAFDQVLEFDRREPVNVVDGMA